MTLPSSRAVAFPRYRVEERSPDLAAFIVGFADTPIQYQTLLSPGGTTFASAVTR
jgi:hypothetical protein